MAYYNPRRTPYAEPEDVVDRQRDRMRRELLGYGLVLSVITLGGALEVTAVASFADQVLHTIVDALTGLL